MSRKPERSLKDYPLFEALGEIGRRLGVWALPHFLEEALASFRRARAWSAFSVSIIGLSLATVGAFLLVTENLRAIVERLSALEVSVYLEPAASPAEIEALQAKLQASPEVASFRHVTREQALETFRALNPELARLQEALGDNPFPASFEVTLGSARRTPAALDSLASRLEAEPGVEYVSRDLEIAERLSAASRLVGVVGAFLGGVLLLAALFTISSVVKLTVYARKDEIEVLRLVGARGAYVRGTFVTEGVLQGFFGALLALLVLYSGYKLAAGYLKSSDLPFLAALTTRYLSGASLASLVLAGVALGSIGSAIPLRRLR